MLELTAIIADQLCGFAVDHVIDPARAVHRIYRDVRFSKDKSPYKTNISAMFPRKGLSKMAGGGYYFSISGEVVEIAGGVGDHPRNRCLSHINNAAACNSSAVQFIS